MKFHNANTLLALLTFFNALGSAAAPIPESADSAAPGLSKRVGIKWPGFGSHSSRTPGSPPHTAAHAPTHAFDHAPVLSPIREHGSPSHVPSGSTSPPPSSTGHSPPSSADRSAASSPRGPIWDSPARADDHAAPDTARQGHIAGVGSFVADSWRTMGTAWKIKVGVGAAALIASSPWWGPKLAGHRRDEGNGDRDLKLTGL